MNTVKRQRIIENIVMPKCMIFKCQKIAKFKILHSLSFSLMCANITFAIIVMQSYGNGKILQISPI